MTLTISKTLTDIVQRGRDRFEVDLATADEIAALEGGLDASPNTAIGDIIGYHFIALRAKGPPTNPPDVGPQEWPQLTIHVLGAFPHPSGVVALRVTSPLRVIGRGRELGRTENSLYRLYSPVESGPSLRAIKAVARVLHAWGIVRAYDLDVVVA